MDIKTRLEDEPLLFSKRFRGNRLSHLNRHGIYTVEDFIHCDIDEVLKHTTRPKAYKTFQKILRNKYLKEDLVLDGLLEREYLNNESQFIKNRDYIIDLYQLGLEFKSYDISKLHSLVVKMYTKNGSIKLIDIIKIIKTYFPDYVDLADYYINIYEEKQITVENASTVEEIKNLIAILLNQRNELDYKISELIEKLNSLENENITKGR